jgi:hypothetical protein
MLTLFGPSTCIISHRVKGVGERRQGTAQGCWMSRVLTRIYLFFKCNMSHPFKDSGITVGTKRDRVERERFPTKVVSDHRKHCAVKKKVYPRRVAAPQRFRTSASETVDSPSERKIITGVLSFKKLQNEAATMKTRFRLRTSPRTNIPP